MLVMSYLPGTLYWRLRTVLGPSGLLTGTVLCSGTAVSITGTVPTRYLHDPRTNPHNTITTQHMHTPTLAHPNITTSPHPNTTAPHHLHQPAYLPLRVMVLSLDGRVEFDYSAYEHQVCCHLSDNNSWHKWQSYFPGWLPSLLYRPAGCQVCPLVSLRTLTGSGQPR